MKVVVDTNVVISAILRDRDPETVLLFVLQSPDVEWIASQKIVEEYLEVLMRPKFGLPLETIALWKERFSKSVLLIESPEVIPARQTGCQVFGLRSSESGGLLYYR